MTAGRCGQHRSWIMRCRAPAICPTTTSRGKRCGERARSRKALVTGELAETSDPCGALGKESAGVGGQRDEAEATLDKGPGALRRRRKDTAGKAARRDALENVGYGRLDHR